jgi:hypothetical protein
VKRLPDHHPVPTDDDLLTTAPAARTIARSEGFVREAADDGRLKSIRTASGTRLFRRGDLHQFRDRE